jgi:uncharacterized protein (DUF1800 family)
MTPAVLAAHRFGLGEPDLGPLRHDPRGWVLAQLRAPAPFDAGGMAGSDDMLVLGRRVLRAALQASPEEPGSRGSAGESATPSPPADSGIPGRPGEPGPLGRTAAPGLPGTPGAPAARAANPDRRALATAVLEDMQRRWQHAVMTPTPVAERWTLFWANHFTVAATKGSTLGMVGPFEREAIRPRAFGRFADLLQASTRHPSMLLYLDNAISVGPGSRLGRRRGRGLNENLARELLELHTLGVDGGYTQADVTETARLLTGWTVPRAAGRAGALGESGEAMGGPASDAPGVAGGGRFVAALHEPGPKRILGRTYPEGPQALDRLLEDLARHPSTARHVARRLVRHFVADDPPAALVDAVSARFRDSDGDLAGVAQALFSHDLAWQADAPPKFKRPEEWVVGAHRLLRRPVPDVAGAARLAAALAEMGQPPGRAPSPQGWPDRRADWLAPDALWKRVEWAASFAQTAGHGVDARALAETSLGAALRAATRLEIERAASPSQALALLLTSPEVLQR